MQIARALNILIFEKKEEEFSNKDTHELYTTNIHKTDTFNIRTSRRTSNNYKNSF